MDWYEYENQLKAKGYSCVCGIDEAGRGPLAGPVFAAAVILPPDCLIDGLNDSKKLTEKKEKRFFRLLKKKRWRGRLQALTKKRLMTLTYCRRHFLPCAGRLMGLV